MVCGCLHEATVHLNTFSQQYVVGGHDESYTALKTMDVYDMQTGEWAAAPPMSTKRDGCGVAEMGGMIYAVGGRGLDTAERFDPASNSWSPLPPMSTKCQWCAAASVGEIGRAHV